MGIGNAGTIGIFDSGVGGLSVLRHLAARIPRAHLVYVADQAHVPYGPRPPAEIQAFSAEITRFLLGQGAQLIVVACNTATAAALSGLRDASPDVPFVGMEPAVKPGAAQTRSGRVGVLATAGTFESQRYADLMARYASDVRLYEDPCRGLVPLIEAGELDGAGTEELLQGCLAPMLAAGVDTIVLGCTHYPFVMPLVSRLAGAEVALIDPAPAVARQAQRLLLANGTRLSGAERGTLMAYTSGDPARFAALAARLLGHAVPVRALRWQAGRLAAVGRDVTALSSHTV